MNIRYWLARKLCPQMAESASKWEYAHSVQYFYARRWLGEFPEICATLDWVFIGTKDYWRPLGVPANCQWRPDIAQFRDDLREMVRKS